VSKKPSVAAIAQPVKDARSRESVARMATGSERRWQSAFFVVLFVLRRSLTVGYRQLSELTNQVQVYEALLRDIYPKLEPQSAQYVEQILNEVRTIPLCFHVSSGLTDITAKPRQRPILWPTNCNAISSS
jgi:hypothetical protein